MHVRDCVLKSFGDLNTLFFGFRFPLREPCIVFGKVHLFKLQSVSAFFMQIRPDELRDTPLQRFVLEEELGRGATGVVHKCRDSVLGSPFAVKIVDVHKPEAFAQWQAEAQFLRQADHPNIPKHVASTQAHGRAYLITPYFPESLEECIRARPINWLDAQAVAIGVLRALEYAHNQNVLHHDVSPKNIRLATAKWDGTKTVKLCDFGMLGKPVDVQKSNPSPAAILGTIPYAAPEQLGLIVERPSPASDIFAVGSVLYEMLTGQKPYGDCPMPSKHSSVLFEGLQVPQALDQIVGRARAHHPGGRYQSAGEMIQALEAVTDTKPAPKRVLKPFLVPLNFPIYGRPKPPKYGVRDCVAGCVPYALTALKYAVSGALIFAAATAMTIAAREECKRMNTARDLQFTEAMEQMRNAVGVNYVSRPK